MLTKEDQIRLFSGWLEAVHIQDTEYSNPPTKDDIEFGARMCRELGVGVRDVPSWNPNMASSELVEGIEAIIKKEPEP